MTEATITVEPDGASGEDVRSLYRLFTGDPELHSRVSLHERPPQPGRLGPVADSVTVVLTGIQTATAVASTVIAWLAHRRAARAADRATAAGKQSVHCEVKVGDRSLTVDLAGPALTPVERTELLTELRQVLEPPAGP